MNERRLLVLGAKRGSVGAAVASAAQRFVSRGFAWDDIVTAGISGEEDHVCNINSTWDRVESFLDKEGPFHDVVCTVGLNVDRIEKAIMVNAVGPLERLQEWADRARRYEDVEPLNSDLPHCSWITISSNSAHVVRSPSPGYCAAKAAVSMGTMCIARHEAKMNSAAEQAQYGLPWNDVRIWGYEPGYFPNTPMTAAQHFDGPPHRIPDGRAGINVRQFAEIVVTDLALFSELRMCTMQRVDAGDQ